MEAQSTFTTKGGLNVTIRPARTDDSCAIIDTVRSNAMERSYVLMEHYGKDVAAEREYISGLDSAKNLLIVAATGDDVVGCLAALQADAGRRPETAHICRWGSISARPSGGSHRTAPARLRRQLAVEKGFKKLEANIFTTNKHSLGLFTKAGFVEEGVRKNRIRWGGSLSTRC